VIEIGKHKLKYINDQITQTTSADFERTMVMRGPVGQPPAAKAGTMKTQAKPELSGVDELVEKTGRFDASAAKPAATAAAKPAAQGDSGKIAVVQILTGANAGKELELVKNLTTLGKPGLQVAVLTRRPQGFFITHVEGAKFPLVNGKALTNQAYQLNDHDVIELAGIKMEFYFKG